jgi:hypothetical protein
MNLGINNNHMRSRTGQPSVDESKAHISYHRRLWDRLNKIFHQLVGKDIDNNRKVLNRKTSPQNLETTKPCMVRMFFLNRLRPCKMCDPPTYLTLSITIVICLTA